MPGAVLIVKNSSFSVGEADDADLELGNEPQKNIQLEKGSNMSISPYELYFPSWRP